MKYLFTLLSFLILPLTIISSDGIDNPYLITATMSQEGVDAGMKILEKGGTAMDAALSVALSEIAETSGKHVSYAGKMNLLYFEAGTGEIHSMNASFNSLLNEKDPSTIPIRNVHNLDDTEYPSSYGRTILVPGFMKGVQEAHKKFGSIPFTNLFENAINIAERGRPWNYEDDYNFKKWKKTLTRYPETKSVFTKPNGMYYEIGDTFQQPELARTLKKVSNDGADYMYKGEWATKFVAAARDLGSKITMKDLENYEVVWSKPVKGKYEGYDIYSLGQPGLGGVRLLETLNIVENNKLSEFGHYSKSPCTLAMLFQILQATQYSSYFSIYQPDYFGDSIDLSFESRLNRKTSEMIWEKWMQMRDVEDCTIQNYGSSHSAAVVAIDKWGNMIALLHTINTINWGFSGLFVDGISIPDPAGEQKDLLTIAGQGNKIPDWTNPGIILNKGQPLLGFSCINSGHHNQTIAAIIDVLDFDMSPQESVESPSIGKLDFIQDVLHLLIEPNRFSDSLLIDARNLNSYLLEDKQVKGGSWTGIHRCPETGKLSGTKVWLK